MLTFAAAATVNDCVAETPSAVAVTTTVPRFGVYRRPLCVMPALVLAHVTVLPGIAAPEASTSVR